MHFILFMEMAHVPELSNSTGLLLDVLFLFNRETLQVHGIRRLIRLEEK